jgi:hypothetical protein
VPAIAALERHVHPVPGILAAHGFSIGEHKENNIRIPRETLDLAVLPTYHLAFLASNDLYGKVRSSGSGLRRFVLW